MAENKKPGDSNDDEVGYGKPPKHSRFKAGKSGNPKGRPKKTRRESTDIAQVLSEPIPVKLQGVQRKLSPFEAGVYRLVNCALKENRIDAALEFIWLCEKYEIIQLPSMAQPYRHIIVPKSWVVEEWKDMFMKHGDPPWPGERSGLPE